MDNLTYQQQHILVAGHHKTAFSMCACFLQAGHRVTLFAGPATDAASVIRQHLADVQAYTGQTADHSRLRVITELNAPLDCELAVAITHEDVAEKAAIISQLESCLPPASLIAINAESMALSVLQPLAKHPARLMVANWAEPVHTTSFLEIVTNPVTDVRLARHFYDMAKTLWHKDPYLLKSDCGIRARMMCALVREAFYLVENDYVTVEDVDRACRNDAGYYMSFAGNFRYMDLMGGYMYGVVMQDLNPELSKNTHIPQFCQQLLDAGFKGMKTQKGFYDYEPGEAEQWAETFRKFSFKIQQIISKYPFNYREAETGVNS